MPRSIITDRLVLRQHAPSDAPRLAQLIADPDVQRWLPLVPHPYGLDDARQFIARARDKPWTLAISSKGALIGGIALAEQLGYWLGKPYWGRGYATEAAKAVLAAWFASHSGDVLSGHLMGNAASRKVLLKLGFRDSTQTARQSLFLGGSVTVQNMVLSRPAGGAAA